MDNPMKPKEPKQPKLGETNPFHGSMLPGSEELGKSFDKMMSSANKVIQNRQPQQPKPTPDPVREKIMKQGFAPKGWKPGDEEIDEDLRKVQNRFENPTEYYNSLPEDHFYKKHSTLDNYLSDYEDAKKYGGPFSDYAGTYSDIFKDEHGYRPRGDYDGILKYAAKSLGVKPGTKAYEYLEKKMEEFKKFHNNSGHYSY